MIFLYFLIRFPLHFYEKCQNVLQIFVDNLVHKGVQMIAHLKSLLRYAWMSYWTFHWTFEKLDLMQYFYHSHHHGSVRIGLRQVGQLAGW